MALFDSNISRTSRDGRLHKELRWLQKNSKTIKRITCKKAKEEKAQAVCEGELSDIE